MAAFRPLDMGALKEIAGSSTLDFDLRRWTETRRIVAEALPALVEAAQERDSLQARVAKLTNGLPKCGACNGSGVDKRGGDCGACAGMGIPPIYRASPGWLREALRSAEVERDALKAEREGFASRASLVDEAQDANASLVRLLAERDETIAALKAEVDRQTALVLAGLKRMEKAVENSLRSLNS